MNQQIVWEDRFLPMYINQWVSGRSVELQGQISRLQQQDANRQQIREARERRKKERVKEAMERGWMSKEDKPRPPSKEQKKIQKEKKKGLKRL